MKQSFLILAGILISFLSFGQTKMNKDSLLIDKKNTSQKVIIRCGGTTVNNQSPLYIVDGVPISSHEFEGIDPNRIVDINLLKGLEALSFCGTQGSNGVVLITTIDGQQNQPIKPQKCAFQVYQIPNENWTTPQEMYNAISVKVPSVQIQQTTPNATPNIIMRGDDTTIVIVDGVRYDASILNSLNPANIESVKVSNFPGAQTFFINQ